MNEKTIVRAATFLEAFRLSVKQARKVIADRNFLIQLSAEDLILCDYELNEDNIKTYYDSYKIFERRIMNREPVPYTSYRAEFLKTINTSPRLNRYTAKKVRQQHNNEYFNTHGARRNTLFNMFDYEETGNTIANWPSKKLKAGSKIAERTIRDYKHALKTNREQLFEDAVQYAEIMLIDANRRTKIEKKIQNDERLSKIPGSIMKEAEERLQGTITREDLESLIEKSNKGSLIYKVLKNTIKGEYEYYTLNPEKSIDENVHCLLYDIRNEEERYRRTRKPLEIEEVDNDPVMDRVNYREATIEDQERTTTGSEDMIEDREATIDDDSISNMGSYSDMGNCSASFRAPYRSNYVNDAFGGLVTTLYDGVRVHVAKLSHEDKEQRKPIQLLG